MCENYICVDCNEIKMDDTHVCDPNAAETMKLLKKVRLSGHSHKEVGLTTHSFLTGHQTVCQVRDDDIQDFRMFTDVVRRLTVTLTGLRPLIKFASQVPRLSHRL